MKNVYDCTNEFENQLANYTGAKYAVAVDNMSNGLFLALYYENYVKKVLKLILLQYQIEHTHQYHVKLYMRV